SALAAVLFYCAGLLLCLPAFPTRRSSDLGAASCARAEGLGGRGVGRSAWRRRVLGRRGLAASARRGGRTTDGRPPLAARRRRARDRKSTRLNSSHQINSYAVFCLKKKTNT